MLYQSNLSRGPKVFPHETSQLPPSSSFLSSEMDFFFDGNRSNVIIETSGPSDGLSTKGDNSMLQGLKDVVSQLQKDVSTNTQVLCDWKSEANKQTQLLADILQQLRNPLPPSFIEDKCLPLDMVVEFGTFVITAIQDLDVNPQTTDVEAEEEEDEEEPSIPDPDKVLQGSQNDAGTRLGWLLGLSQHGIGMVKARCWYGTAEARRHKGHSDSHGWASRRTTDRPKL
ncbi:hypothetical protein L6452_01762 [Arctium lappa]|uniref:Uncharacterized protein n=1 Tax=Arctium lappa TaxID=4217 RepID=A0ACB9FJ17_ARCLA|nr:hypothetical protein L6452_01762 [Arctium lappa]